MENYQEQDIIKDEINVPRSTEHFKNSMISRGFSFNMTYQEFDSYISVLSAEQKNELFHSIYENYLYAGSLLNSKNSGLSQRDCYKVMSKMKRYEMYLYKILRS